MAILERITESTLPSNYVDGEDVTHTDLNKIIDVFRAGSNANYADIQNLWDGTKMGGDSSKLNGAELSKQATTILLDDDTKVPTSSQVFNAINVLSTSVGNVMTAIKGCAKSYKVSSDTVCLASTSTHIGLGDLIGGFGNNITLDTNDIKLGALNTTMEMSIQLGVTVTVATNVTISVEKNDVPIYSEVKALGTSSNILIKLPFTNFSPNDIIKLKVNPNNDCTVTVLNSHIDVRTLG